MRLYTPKPNHMMVMHASKEFDKLHNGNYDPHFFTYPHHWLDMAVYDALGGYAARVSAARAASYERWRTQQWFDQRAQYATPSEVVLANLLEEEMEVSHGS